jgi:murein endopeptidase
MASLMAALLLLLGGQASQAHRDRHPEESPEPRIEWHDSVALGTPGAGSLQGGVKLPAAGRHFFTWDPILKRRPNRAWRRWATDELVHTLLEVIRAYARAHPGAARVGIGDLSRPHGGSFGPEFGGIGHATHQNGLDADVYYPLLDGAERAPLSAAEIDPGLSQELVDRFVRAGATTIYVGPNTGLTGPPGIVIPLVNHDNHLHVRVAP